MSFATTSSTQKPPRPLKKERRQPNKNIKVKKPSIYRRAIAGAIWRLNPKAAIQNPVMFLVWVGMLITACCSIEPTLFGPVAENNPHLFYGVMTGVLLLTLLFGNFAYSFAKARGKAKAENLRTSKLDNIAKKLSGDGAITEIPSINLRRGDVVYILAGDTIPADGEVIMGAGSVDESLITGESAPILKESGSEIASSVTGGTRLISDELIVRITADAGKGFIDKMIALLEGKRLTKTSNETALKVFLAALSFIFLLVVASLPAMAYYLDTPISVPILVGIFTALIPTTIGSLLNAIGLAGMDRVAKFNVIANSAAAVETCGDIHTLVLDKTGTITLGNRLAEEFVPVYGHSLFELATIALSASIFDNTPEGKSIIRLAERLGAKLEFDTTMASTIEFSPQTRISGTNLPNGMRALKGAVESIRNFVGYPEEKDDSELDQVYQRVCQQGGTPLAVCLDNEIYGVIYLRDIVKPGIRDRFEQLRRIGIDTVMVTGDNQITSSVIAQEAGVNEFVAEATPEDKVELIQKYQAEGKLVAMAGDGNNDAAALGKANVGIAMNTGTQAAKQASKLVDLDSDPTKLIDIVTVGKELLITRGALTAFSITNDIAKYFAIIPTLFAGSKLQGLNIMNLTSIQSAILSTLIYNLLVIPAVIPFALGGIKFIPLNPNRLLLRNVLIFGLGGVIIPFIVIKAVDLIITAIGLA